MFDCHRNKVKIPSSEVAIPRASRKVSVTTPPSGLEGRRAHAKRAAHHVMLPPPAWCRLDFNVTVVDFFDLRKSSTHHGYLVGRTSHVPALVGLPGTNAKFAWPQFPDTFWQGVGSSPWWFSGPRPQKRVESLFGSRYRSCPQGHCYVRTFIFLGIAVNS